jgi:hypothetical protein
VFFFGGCFWSTWPHEQHFYLTYVEVYWDLIG